MARCPFDAFEQGSKSTRDELREGKSSDDKMSDIPPTTTTDNVNEHLSKKRHLHLRGGADPVIVPYRIQTRPSIRFCSNLHKFTARKKNKKTKTESQSVGPIGCFPRRQRRKQWKQKTAQRRLLMDIWKKPPFPPHHPHPLRCAYPINSIAGVPLLSHLLDLDSLRYSPTGSSPMQPAP